MSTQIKEGLMFFSDLTLGTFNDWFLTEKQEEMFLKGYEITITIPKKAPHNFPGLVLFRLQKILPVGTKLKDISFISVPEKGIICASWKK